ncbi:MAG: flagellar hook-basal body complex protein [Lachnospiraceae bacterium]|nr:flagellar hook-basal body complex protein [Lachnospiraceae bacterium]MBO7531815.1 flagellar hook-basal body complex protein [Lachnospiraceae bacterium]MBP5761427.1 flagellar hook-basal body complex protein [Lachnospiraceae bacterium]
MMRSLYSGVAGLKTHQTKMDVIGNNIANVNTTAFKSSSVTFADLMSQTTQSASGANATTGVGGVNARQIGLGVKSGAINVNISSQGSAQSTGNPFDIMITGSNFFVVSDGLANYFTRDGSFYVDGVGNLCMTSTGYNVMGWGVDPETLSIKQDTVQALRIMSAENLTYPPEATTKGTVTGILDKNDTDVNSEAGKTVNLNLYDSLGYEYTARFVIKSTDEDGEYSAELTKLLDAKGNEIDISGAGDIFGNSTSVKDAAAVTFNSNSFAWDTTAKALTDKATPTPNVIASLSTVATSSSATAEEQQAVYDAIAKAYGYEGNTDAFLNMYVTVGTTDYTVKALIQNAADGSTTPNIFDPDADTATTTFNFDSAGRNFVGQLLKFDTDTGLFDSIGGNILGDTTLQLSKIIANTTDNTSNYSDISLNWAGISMFNNNGTSTITATYGDKDGIGTGRKLGDMIGVSIQRDGMIYASYDNGMTKLLGQIATASFPNSSGLEKHGDNLYQATMNSGSFDGIGVDVTASGGYMSTGVLEMSNVDLSAEFTEMITTQRGFQANSRIITVSDTLLEELTNLKR